MKKFIDTQFDEQFRSIQNLHWLPWVGKDYFNVPLGKRLLIVGESHYVPEGENEDDGYNEDSWTRNFICKEGLKQPPLYLGNAINPLIRNTEKTIYNTQNPSDNDKQKLWCSSAYFNLIQKLLSSRKDEDRPKNEYFIEGWKVFFELVEILQPDVCLILGKSGFGLLGHYLNNYKTNWTIKIDIYDNEKVVFLSNKNQTIKLLFIKHPSSYFSWKKWAIFINNQIKDYLNWLTKETVHSNL